MDQSWLVHLRHTVTRDPRALGASASLPAGQALCHGHLGHVHHQEQGRGGQQACCRRHETTAMGEKGLLFTKSVLLRKWSRGADVTTAAGRPGLHHQASLSEKEAKVDNLWPPSEAW